jgi:putative MATE family efflux protein
VISRFIGAKDKISTDSAATHIIIISALISIVMTVVGYLILDPVLNLLVVDVNVKNYACKYGIIFVFTTIVCLFEPVFQGILKGEGDIKRSTYAMLISCLLNILLDPLFIYVFKFGIAGAAWVTFISMLTVCIVYIYWLSKSSYINISFKGFKFNQNIIKTFLLVGLPCTLEFCVLSLLYSVINFLLDISSSGNGVPGIATYNVGWKVVIFCFIPLTAISQAVIPIIGASLGKKDYDAVKVIRNYAIKLELVIAIIISFIMFIFAAQIATIFTNDAAQIATTSTRDGPNIYTNLVLFFHIIAFMIAFTPLGTVPGAIFQGLGKGIHSLIFIFVRELVLVIFFSSLFVLLKQGEFGVWVGISVGNICGCIFAYIYTDYYIKKFLNIP